MISLRLRGFGYAWKDWGVGPWPPEDQDSTRWMVAFNLGVRVNFFN